ncbi:hypothetical protein JW766_04485 [Candidatus Dojkabacteria bacterium]|nr:hypothetical protein [Candidatus Dojkabacteria bacterium]
MASEIETSETPESAEQGLTGGDLKEFVLDRLSRIYWPGVQETAWKVGGVTAVILSTLAITIKFRGDAPFIPALALTALAHLGSPLGYAEYLIVGGPIGVAIAAGAEKLVEKFIPPIQEELDTTSLIDPDQFLIEDIS